jgi:hypothetical protein
MRAFIVLAAALASDWVCVESTLRWLVGIWRAKKERRSQLKDRRSDPMEDE